MIFINAVCDGGCSTLLPLRFDGDDETAFDLKVAIKAAGWEVEGSGGTGNQTLTCPSCLLAPRPRP